MELDTPTGVEIICYVDDLDVLVTANSIEESIQRGNSVLYKIESWMEKNHLEVAAEKTACVVFGWSCKNKRQISFKFGEHIIRPTIGKIMPNVGGPSGCKRRVLATVLQSVIAYATPVWCEAIGVARNRRRLASCQRKVALLCIRAYHTGSADAAVLLAGLIPITELIKERTEVYKRHAEGAERQKYPREIATEERQRTFDRWQAEWQTSGENGVASWTRKLIRNVRDWVADARGDGLGYGQGSWRTAIKRILDQAQMDLEKDKSSTVQGRDTPVPVGLDVAVAGHSRRVLAFTANGRHFCQRERGIISDEIKTANLVF
ncbi:hypothetical protein HUJ05_007617 [Dendroctonus ponderosae]|nr:hypothetical protein HUJ05_007617 [Dendroctonus ponderosae]